MISNTLQKSLLLTSLLLTGFGCLAADWPRWRGPDNTGQVPNGAAVPKTLPTEPKIVWQIKVTDGLSSPTVSGGKVFHADNQGGKETLHALDAASGKALWSVAYDDVFRDSQSAPGPRCTPTVDGERVYIQSYKGELQCLSVADGKQIWRANYVKDFGAAFTGERGASIGANRHGFTGAPLVEGEHLIVAASGPAASVVCFDKLTGKVVWKSQSDVAGYAAPVAATIGGVRQFVIFTAQSVIGLGSDGKLLWRVPLETQWGRHAMTPVVVDDTVLVSSHTAGLVGVRVTKQGETWSAERAWTNKEVAVNFCSPVAVKGYFYGLGPAKMMFCVDAKSGKTAWMKESFFGSAIRRGYAGFLTMRDTILVLTDGGQLLLIAADPKECRTIAQTQVSGDTWCNPAYSDGKLFLRDDKQLMCLQLLP